MINKEELERRFEAAGLKGTRVSASGSAVSARLPAGEVLFAVNIFQSPACCAVAEIGNISIGPSLHDKGLLNDCIDYTISKITNRSSVYINLNGTTMLTNLQSALDLRMDMIVLPKHKNPNTSRIISQYFKVIKNRV